MSSTPEEALPPSLFARYFNPNLGRIDTAWWSWCGLAFAEVRIGLA